MIKPKCTDSAATARLLGGSLLFANLLAIYLFFFLNQLLTQTLTMSAIMSLFVEYSIFAAIKNTSYTFSPVFADVSTK